jgi:hypothetical protein
MQKWVVCFKEILGGECLLVQMVIPVLHMLRDKSQAEIMFLMPREVFTEWLTRFGRKFLLLASVLILFYVGLMFFHFLNGNLC